MKVKKIVSFCLTFVILLQMVMTSVFALDNGMACLYTFTWSDLSTRDTANATVLRHLTNMGYSPEEHLNYGAPAVYSAFPDPQILVIASHGNAGRVKLGTDNSVSRIFANRSVSGDNRSLSNLGSSSLAGVRLVMFSTCYSGVTSSTEGNLVTMTRSKGAQCVVGWNDTLENDSSNEWVRLFFEKADQEHDVIWECFNHADYWTREIHGDYYADLLVDRHEQGNISQYLYK